MEFFDSSNHVVDLATNLLAHASQVCQRYESIGCDTFLEPDADEVIVDLVADFKRKVQESRVLGYISIEEVDGQDLCEPCVTVLTMLIEVVLGELPVSISRLLVDE